MSFPTLNSEFSRFIHPVSGSPKLLDVCPSQVAYSPEKEHMVFPACLYFSRERSEAGARLCMSSFSF